MHEASLMETALELAVAQARAAGGVPDSSAVPTGWRVEWCCA